MSHQEHDMLPENTPPTGEKAHIWDKPKNVDRLLRVFYALCVLLVGLDFILPRESHHPWEGFFGFHAFYGFVACWTLVGFRAAESPS